MNDRGNTGAIRVSQIAPTGKDAEETLHAIALGDADALVIETEKGLCVYTLKDANEPYRHLVECMSEAALIVGPSGVVFYSNEKLDAMLGRNGGAEHGFLDLVGTDQRCCAERLLAMAGEIQTSAR